MFKSKAKPKDDDYYDIRLVNDRSSLLGPFFLSHRSPVEGLPPPAKNRN
jgi:hypothetical protein